MRVATYQERLGYWRSRRRARRAVSEHVERIVQISARHQCSRWLKKIVSQGRVKNSLTYPHYLLRQSSRSRSPCEMDACSLEIVAQASSVDNTRRISLRTGDVWFVGDPVGGFVAGIMSANSRGLPRVRDDSVRRDGYHKGISCDKTCFMVRTV